MACAAKDIGLDDCFSFSREGSPMKTFELNALPLEYELLYGSARRNLDLADVVNNTLRFGVVGVLGLRFQEQRLDLGRIGESSPGLNDRGDARVVMLNGVQPLP